MSYRLLLSLTAVQNKEKMNMGSNNNKMMMSSTELSTTHTHFSCSFDMKYRMVAMWDLRHDYFAELCGSLTCWSNFLDSYFLLSQTRPSSTPPTTLFPINMVSFGIKQFSEGRGSQLFTGWDCCSWWFSLESVGDWDIEKWVRRQS